MSVMVIGDFRVEPGSEGDFEDAFRSRPSRDPRPAATAVYFGRSEEQSNHYRRVGIWESREEWERFQAGAAQREFFSGVLEHLSEDPRFEFYELLE